MSEIRERLERLVNTLKATARQHGFNGDRDGHKKFYHMADGAEQALNLLPSVAQQPQPMGVLGSREKAMNDYVTEHSRAASAPVQEEKPDADYIADSHYVAGAMFGWNMGVSNLEDKFWRTLENRNRAMQEYRRARHSSGISEVTDMSRRDQTEKWDEKRSEVSQPTNFVSDVPRGVGPSCHNCGAITVPCTNPFAGWECRSCGTTTAPSVGQKVAEPITAEQFYATGYGDKVCYNGPQWYEFAEEFAKFKGAEQTASLRSQLETWKDNYQTMFDAHEHEFRLREVAESALRQKELAIAAASNPAIRAMVEDGIESAKAQSGVEVSALRSRESVAIDYAVSAREILAMLWPNLNDTFHSKAKREIAVWLRSHDQKLRGRQSLTIERPEILEYLWREQGCPGTVQEFPTLAAQFTGSSLALVIERWEKWRNEQGWSLDKGLVRSVMHLCSLLQMTHNYQYQWLWDADNRQTVTAETAIAEANKLVASYRQATQPQTEPKV